MREKISTAADLAEKLIDQRHPNIGNDVCYRNELRIYGAVAGLDASARLAGDCDQAFRLAG
jgi:hypothetical protein